MEKEIEKLINSVPPDFCNDGEYTDKEMIECLSNVVKKQQEILLLILEHIKHG